MLFIYEGDRLPLFKRDVETPGHYGMNDTTNSMFTQNADKLVDLLHLFYTFVIAVHLIP